MADPTGLPKQELERGRDLGGAMYLTSYVRLMMRELGIPDTDREGVNAMVLKMVEPLNTATEAAWRALMEDHKGMRDALQRFEGKLGQI